MKLLLNKWRANIRGEFISPLILFVILIFHPKIWASELVSLDKVIELVRANNAETKLAQLDLEIAKKEQRASLHPLDTQLSLSYFKEHSRDPQNSKLEKSTVTESTNGFSLGIEKTFITATKLEASLQSLQIKSDSLNAVGEDRNQTAALFNIKQPLLSKRVRESLVKESVLAPIKIRRYEAKLHQTLNEEVKESLDIYYDLYAIFNELKVRKNNILIYEKLYEYHKKAHKVGLKDKIKPMEVLSLLEKEKSLLLNKENKWSSLNLKLKKNLGKLTKLKFESSLIDLTSLKNNTPDKFYKLKEINQQILEQEVELAKAKNNALPGLDLELEYLSPGITANTTESLKIVKKSTFPNFTLSLNYTWKFGNKIGKGNVAYNEAKLKYLKKRLAKESENNNNKLIQVKKKTQLTGQIVSLNMSLLEAMLKKVSIRDKMYRMGKVSIVDLEETIKDYTVAQKKYYEKITEQQKLLNEKHYLNGVYGKKL